MDPSSGLSSDQAARRTTAAARAIRRAEGVAAGGQQPSAGTATGPASTIPASTGPASTRLSAGDRHDRMVRRMNDVVVRRIFAAGLDLQAALGLIGEDRATDSTAASKVCHARDELDQAIRDLRDILFEAR